MGVGKSNTGSIWRHSAAHEISPAFVLLWLFLFAAISLSGISASHAVEKRVRGRQFDAAKAARLAQEYLDSDDDDERAELAAKLRRYRGNIDDVILRLSAGELPEVEPGYLPKQHFSEPDLLEEYPDNLLYFTIPRGYRPDRPTGLIIFMHGGGNESPHNSPRWFMNFPNEDDEESHQLGDLFDATGMIAVGPSAPWDDECWYRWCLPEADDYLDAVIRECKRRFAIDPDRVFLFGHSMGGFGAFHHVQRQPDRFAAVIANAGSWSLAYWPAIRGTKLCIIGGVTDAERGERWHHTDIAYARWTDTLLDRLKLDYVYYEHEDGHWVGYGKPYAARFFAETQALRRDPYYPHVVVASPIGFRPWYARAVKHNRWITLDESTEGTIEYDQLTCDEDVDFDDWRLTYSRVERNGATIDAENRGNNTIVVKTQNVASFSVWLHPRMIDVEKPVTIEVNGRELFRDVARQSLDVALESYERRHDWGLIYPIKIELAVPDDEDE